MTESEHPGKPAADDVAADMERRLDELEDRIADAERKEHALPENPLSSVAGDPAAISEGRLSRGATPAAAEHEEPEDA
jgi:hypothetical protein